MSQPIALILAGGENSRADAYRNGKPKCLLPLGDGKPILVHLLDRLSEENILPVVLGGHRDVCAVVDPYNVSHLNDTEPGIISALRGAVKFLNHRRDTTILICYGDTFLPGFEYAKACVPGTLTVSRAFPTTGNVSTNEVGIHYLADFCDGDWLEAGATCISHSTLSNIDDFETWPQFLASKPWPRVCYHDGWVINVGDARSYREALKWQP